MHKRVETCGDPLLFSRSSQFSSEMSLGVQHDVPAHRQIGQQRDEERSKLNTAWFIRTGFPASERSRLTHFMKCHTLHAQSCTPLGFTCAA